MVLVYLIRHAESVINNKKERIFCGQYDCILTQRGMEQAKSLSSINTEFNLALVSDSIRSKDTFYLSNLVSKKVLFLKELRERSLGDFEGKKVNAIFSDIIYKEYWPDGPYKYFRTSFTQSAPNGESYNDVCCRLELVVNKIENMRENEKILIISHYHTIRCLLYLLGLVDVDSILKINVSNCEVIKLVSKINNGFKIIN